jgi:hypothetical protein
MTLLTTDVLAIIIALGSACAVMVLSIRAYGRLMNEHIQLERAYAELLHKNKVSL